MVGIFQDVWESAIKMVNFSENSQKKRVAQIFNPLTSHEYIDVLCTQK